MISTLSGCLTISSSLGVSGRCPQLPGVEELVITDCGYGRAVLWVLDGNARAILFYATDGWSSDGARRTETLWGIEATDVRYRRALP